MGDRNVKLTQKTDYPWEERVVLTVSPDSPGEFTLALRVPGWCRGAKLSVNGRQVALKTITGKGWDDGLYRSERSRTRQVPLTAVPYCLWANRAPGEMLVWIRSE